MRTAILVMKTWQWNGILNILMGIDHRLFWANLFLHSSEEEYMPLLISSDYIIARHFHSTKHFIDDNCAINDGGELSKESLFVIYIHKSLSSLRLNIRVMMLPFWNWIWPSRRAPLTKKMFKIDMKNLTNFGLSTRKSQKFAL